MNAPIAHPALAQTTSAAPAALLRFITCGSVDDGKSTLIGRILYDSGSVPDDQLAALASESRKFGTQGDALDLALLVDGLAAEREQGITIDVAYRYFSTPKRAFIVADTPGHEQYTRNMATGASGAELAIILVDARKGVLAQTRRHSFIVSMAGVRSVVVAINKMDLVGFDQHVFESIAESYRAATQSLGFEEIVFIPVSALGGDNIATPSPATPWYRGPTLLHHLETVDAGAAAAQGAFRMPVQWVNRPSADFRGFSGTIAMGRIARGDDVRVSPSGLSTRIARILGAAGETSEAQAGEAVTLVFADEIDASRGDVIASPGAELVVARQFDARILWMSERPATAQGLILQQGCAQSNATLALRAQIDVDTFRESPAETLGVNGIGRARLRLEKPLTLAPYAQDRTLGAFILIDRMTNDTVALGVIDVVDPLDRGPRVSAPNQAQALWKELLAPSAGAGDWREALSWRVVSALAIAGVAGAASGHAGVALLAGAADFALRLALRAAHRDLFGRLAARRGGLNADGDGI